MLENFVDRSPVDLSIIILTYNHKDYIRHCIDSVLMQRFDFKTEVIIGDDCSTDGTVEILKEYKEKYPFLQLVLREENIGGTRNAYELSCMMQGRYYAYLEGDDYWCDENKLQLQYDHLLSHPELVGCYHDCNIVDATEKPVGKPLYWVSRKKRFSFEDFDGIRLPGHSSTWMRKNLYRFSDVDLSSVYKFNRHIGDRTVILVFLANGDFERIDKTMSCYRLVRGNSSRSLTAAVYSGTNAFSTEYELVCSYEKYCSVVLKREKSMEKRKNKIICDVFCYLLRSRNRDALVMLKKYISLSRNKVISIISIPKNIILKFICKVFYVQ